MVIFTRLTDLAPFYDVVEVEMATETKRVNLSRLPPERKQKAWQWLQETRPAQAELIQSKAVQEIISAFDGEIIIEVETKQCEN
ncbi:MULTISPECIES: hypothetical protein [unclassified Methylophaga]|uniref:hypothetical protein n=1 Tax=unclassified Methylophaga TaxID=2629249 RepID=UPI002600C5DF|nr:MULTISPECIES: hypothetical protein [unclassified Methylophaga]